MQVVTVLKFWTDEKNIDNIILAQKHIISKTQNEYENNSLNWVESILVDPGSQRAWTITFHLVTSTIGQESLKNFSGFYFTTFFSNISCPIVEFITFDTRLKLYFRQRKGTVRKISNKWVKILKFWRTELSIVCIEQTERRKETSFRNWYMS